MPNFTKKTFKITVQGYYHPEDWPEWAKDAAREHTRPGHTLTIRCGKFPPDTVKPGDWLVKVNDRVIGLSPQAFDAIYGAEDPQPSGNPGEVEEKPIPRRSCSTVIADDPRFPPMPHKTVEVSGIQPSDNVEELP